MNINAPKINILLFCLAGLSFGVVIGRFVALKELNAEIYSSIKKPMLMPQKSSSFNRMTDAKPDQEQPIIETSNKTSQPAVAAPVVTTVVPANKVPTHIKNKPVNESGDLINVSLEKSVLLQRIDDLQREIKSLKQTIEMMQKKTNTDAKKKVGRT